MVKTMTSATNTNTTSSGSAHLDNATLRERILTSGAGNARGSLTKVASQYRDFIHQVMRTRSDAANDDDTNNNKLSTAADNLKTELLLHDLEVRKLILSSKAYTGNSSTYNSTLQQMQSSLSTIQNDIESLTTTLLQQRQIHSKRREYNALAKISNEKHPPIHKTQCELDKVTEQIEQVQSEVEVATAKLHLREKQLRTLMSCLGDLKASLNEEEMMKQVTVVRSGGDNDEKKKSGEKMEGEIVAAAGGGGGGGGTKRKRDDADAS